MLPAPGCSYFMESYIAPAGRNHSTIQGEIFEHFAFKNRWQVSGEEEELQQAKHPIQLHAVFGVSKIFK